MFGPHLIIDGSKCDTTKLADRLLVERILSDYPRAIGMTRIGGPYMFEYQAPDPAYSGVSGLVVIAESHIAIHTFPALDYFTMDIFSCKNFDHEVAIDYIRDALGVKEMDRMLVQRGLSFRGPHHGPLGATDELVAAAAARHEGIEGITTGSIPSDDPLYPKAEAGRMLWPAYGTTPDLGDYQPDVVSLGARDGAIVVPANADAAGALARPGLSPIHPMQLNPTASTSGVIDRMLTLGGKGRQLGKALAQWEVLARSTAPVVLALGPQIVADGLRDVIADLIHRGHVDAIIVEGETLLADAYETLGYRHYVDVEGESDVAVHTDEEWHAALTTLSSLIPATDVPTTTQELATQLGLALSTSAPRPGILTTAAQKGIPVIAVGATGLDLLGITTIDGAADVAALRVLLSVAGAGIVAFGTTESTSALVSATGVKAHVIANDAAAFESPSITNRVDAAIALPLLATGIVQRVPNRARATTIPDVAIRDTVMATR